MKKRYYRVGAFYRNEDSKSVIVQCYDRNEAEGWIEGAKAMLFPGENTEGFTVRLYEFKLQINQNNLNHYRITVERPIEREFEDFEAEMDYENSLAFDAIVEADDEEAAKRVFLEEWFELYAAGRGRENYDLYVDEVPLEEMIETEQRLLRQRLVSKYIYDKYGDISVREYSEMMRRADKDQMFYEALAEHLKEVRMTEYLEKRLDTGRLSYAEFAKIRDALCDAKIGEEFERINVDAITRYGKETKY